MIAEEHIWKTNDGGYTLDGDSVEACLLAYAAGDDVPDEVMSDLKGAKKPANKAQAKPADKSAAKPSDK